MGSYLQTLEPFILLVKFYYGIYVLVKSYYLNYLQILHSVKPGIKITINSAKIIISKYTNDTNDIQYNIDTNMKLPLISVQKDDTKCYYFV